MKNEIDRIIKTLDYNHIVMFRVLMSTLVANLITMGCVFYIAIHIKYGF